MERARPTCSDERLADLARRMDVGFTRVDSDIRALRTDLGGRIDRIDIRIDGLRRSIESLQRIMVQFAGGMTIAIIATLVTVVLTRG